jgi:hypothetical protein
VTRHDDAIQQLYQAPLAQFVAERKRLAGELRAAGDAAGAKALLARKRPSISAWVVNQLYWYTRDAFDAMLATAGKLRAGDLSVQPAHRDAIASLRGRAARFLEDSGHAASEPTLRRVTTTLAALAAAGGFDPDPPGALVEDRDAPGFEGAVVAGAGSRATDLGVWTESRSDDQLAKHRQAEEEKRKREERHRLEAALRTAKGEVQVAEKQLERAQHELEKARQAARDLETELEALD